MLSILFKTVLSIAFTSSRFEAHGSSSILNKCIRKAETSYYHTQFTKYKRNIKITWIEINSVINKASSKRVPSSIIISDAEITENKSIANHFNTYFNNTGKNLAASLDSNNLKMYTDHHTLLNKCFQAAKRQYFLDKILVAGKDPKQQYSVINQLQHKNKPKQLPDHKYSSELANKFLHFFDTKIANIRAEMASAAQYRPYKDENIFSGHPLQHFKLPTVKDIQNIICSSPSKQSTLDPIPTSIIKSCLHVFAPVITDAVISSLSSGCVPCSLKTAVISPLLKKPNLDRDILNHYRPISNLPFLAKVLEKVVSSCLVSHMRSNGLYETYQSAYRAYHSTETCLVKVQNDILCAMDRHELTVLLLLDLSAAFSTVDHEILLQRLSIRLGITGPALEWFQSYLSCRHQFVDINGVSSESSILKYGVPEGSVLGPLLFTIYMLPLGDIMRKHNIKFHSYADDTQLYLSFSPTKAEGFHALSCLTKCVSEIELWMKANLLKLNTEKTEILVLGTKSVIRKYQLDDFRVGLSSISPSETVRNLGSIFDPVLNMACHVTSLCKSAYYHLYNLGKVRKCLSKGITEKLIHAFVSSRLDYGNSLLYGINSCLLDKLQCVQNSAARLLTGTKKYEHISPILAKLHWLPVRSRIEYKILLLTFRALNNIGPQYIRDLLNIYTPPRNLRSIDKHVLVVPNSKMKTAGDRAFSCIAPRLWNGLPEDIKSSRTLENFKSKLKTYLFKKSFNV